MNVVPPELTPFFTFFHLVSTPENHQQFLHSVALNYGLILAGSGNLSGFEAEEGYLQDETYFSSYFIPRRDAALGAQHLLEQLKSTFSDGFDFAIDNAGHIVWKNHGKIVDLFPFFLGHSNEVFSFSKAHNRGFVYSSAGGTTRTIDPSSPLFEELAGAFFEKQWYRTVLVALENWAGGHKHLENKLYSAHCFLACEYYKRKKYDDSVIQFEKAMQIKSSMPQLYYNLALSYARLKSYKTGVHFLNQVNRLKPNQSKTYELLGDFYFQLGDCERSVLLYQKAIELSENKLLLESKLKKVEEKFPRARPETKKEEDKEEKFSLNTVLLDLTLEAELGKFQPVLGRENEILQMQEILACQGKKNLLLLGDPGVGKTALINEFAYRLIAGKLSPRLNGKKLIRVNMGLILAGAKFRGQFEERLMQLIREVKKLDCILFIDDIHQIVSGGTGKPAAMEASHFIKPALLNDEIQLIGVTSFEEFRNSIEKDSSFLRCFQLLKLEEPDNETLIKILQSYRSSLEAYHQVIITDDALEAVRTWTKVLLRDRALPDKSLDILDRAAARISIKEKAAIVNGESVLETISEISGIPVNRMSISETAHFRNAETLLSRRVVGQTTAIQTVSRVLCTSKLRMNLNPVRPKGIFLFVGPTGVGKTELARAMTEFLFGHEDKIIRIDMSEYMERYSASRLIGTSPGYVGYYDQNQLVDKIRNNPYSLILLDEIEKADAQLLNIFLQVFDAGRLTDGKGKVAYFDNATIVMTSNIGTSLFAQNRMGYGSEQMESQVTRTDLLKEVKRFFSPEFLNRIDEIVYFAPLTQQDVVSIVKMKLTTIHEQLSKQNKELFVTEKAIAEICKLGYDYEYGARNLERVLRRELLDKLAKLALNEEWETLTTVVADVKDREIVLQTTKDKSTIQEEYPSELDVQKFLEQ